MRKILFLVLALSVFVVTNASAAGQAYLWGGYTTVNMEDLNDGFDAVELIGIYMEEKNFEKSKIRDAFIVGVDYLFDINKNVKVGPRVAFLQTNKGKIGFGRGERRKSLEVNTSLVPIMFGGSCNKNISEKFSLNWKLFFGCGIVKYKSTSFYSIDESENAFKKEFSEDKSCFVADVSIGAQHSFTKRFGLGLDLGWRFTPKTEIKMKNENGDSVMKLDFSGLITKLSLSYKI